MIPRPGIRQGTRIGHFTVQRKLGAGAMGEVWLAHQEVIDREVALKVLAPALTRDPAFVQRFMKEVRTAGRLEHPNIITAHDAGEHDGIYYMAVAYVDGEDVSQLLARRGVLPESEALSIAHGVAEALDYAWDRFQILHRDVKPSNIMLTSRDEVRVMDLGISKSMSDEASLTMTGYIVGTPHYMSPEQARAEVDLNFRTDVYALGATLYHLVTGDTPYHAATAMGILTKHITDPLRPPRVRNPNVSEPCSALIETMMAKDRNERQSSWGNVTRDIDAVLVGAMPATPRPTSGQSAVQPMNSEELRRIRSASTMTFGATSHPAADEDTAARKRSKRPLAIGLGFAAVAAVAAVLGAMALRQKPEAVDPVASTVFPESEPSMSPPAKPPKADPTPTPSVARRSTPLPRPSWLPEGITPVEEARIRMGRGIAVGPDGKPVPGTPHGRVILCPLRENMVNHEGLGTLPEQVKNATDIVAIGAAPTREDRTRPDAPTGFGVALRANGTLVGWGAGYQGRTHLIPPDGLSGVVAFDLTALHFAALTSAGTVACWGMTTSADYIVKPATLCDVVAVSAGCFATTVAKADGGVTGWFNPPFECSADQMPKDLAGVIALATHKNVGIALRSDGAVSVWGSGRDGAWQQVDAVAVAAQRDIALALTHSGTVESWGSGHEDAFQDYLAGLTGITRLRLSLSDNGLVYFAARKGSGEWLLYGPEIDVSVCERRLEGCIDVAFGLNHAIGLMPVE